MEGLVILGIVLGVIVFLVYRARGKAGLGSPAEDVRDRLGRR